MSPALVASEHAEQSLLFQWACVAEGQHPELALLFAIPNFSGRLGNAPPLAAIRHAQKLNREGRKRGVPDICLPVGRGSHHALYLEMKKSKGGTVSSEQKAWHAALSAAGNRVVVCKGWEAGRDALLAYLSAEGR
jgi:hypothetical protein